MSNINTIDDYLANRLSDADKIAFEQRLSADPELRQEFSFQKDVIGGIQTKRKAQLKNMLDNIPVSSATGSTFGASVKIAASLVIAAAVIGGVYFLTNQDSPVSDNKQNEQPTLIEEDTTQPSQEVQPLDDKKEEQKEPLAPTANQEQPADKNVAQQTTPAEIKTPNLIEDFDTGSSTPEIEQPEVYSETEDLKVENLFNSSIEVITDDSKKKYKFHYRFKDEKLYLFGSFDHGLYEILEFNNEGGTTIILYYKDSYYLLKNSQVEITPLEPIKNPALIDKLNNLRK